ncbi:hypothetical protein LPJ70_000363 [Coemansia sp. RSA 2708]|nr:hypothetical protein LPJ70_000363 [Coemansia sp. RSA 2708]
MGAIENDDGSDDSDEPGNYAAAEDLANELTNPNTRTVDAESFLNMLMQSGSSAEQQTSLLDNIMSQFGQGQLLVGADSTAHSALDAEVTRVGTMAADDEQDTTIHMNAAAEAADESDDSDDAASNENDDAVTMELTGIVPRQHEGDDDEDDNGSENSAGERGTSALPVSSSAFLSQLDPFINSFYAQTRISHAYLEPSSAPAANRYCAKAGLVLGIFDAYSQQQLAPEPSVELEQLSELPIRFEPLYRKAQLTARRDYCVALSGLFEADRIVSETAAAEPVQLESLVSFFEEQNDLLAQRKKELLLRISKAKQRLAQEAPGNETGKLASEIQSLRDRLGRVRQEREVAGTKVEQLGAEAQALQATCTTFDRQLTEKKSAQSILLAINGLQPAEVTADACDFIYDKFSKLHFADSAEFTSLHPDIDWSAVVRSSIDSSELSMRQYTIAAMKANVALKGLLEDVRKVKQHTFVDIHYSDGIQIRVQFFSLEQRRRFHLQIPLATVDSYARLYEETEFEWPTDVVYGDVDANGLKKCLRSCRIDPVLPVLSIYQHVESSMETF